MENQSPKLCEGDEGNSMRPYAKPTLKRFGTLVEVTRAVGEDSPNDDGGIDFVKTA